MVDLPVTRYERSGETSIAYQVVGRGAVDLVFIMGWVSNLDWLWREPRMARFLRGLAAFSRLILLDKRGTGLSDRVGLHELPTLEVRMDDLRAVMDACGSSRAAVMGVSEGGPLCTLFAATYPERTHPLVVLNGYARRLAAPGYPMGMSEEAYDRFLVDLRHGWGSEPLGIDARLPSLASDPELRRWWTDHLRQAASPGAALALATMNGQIDVRAALPAIRVPTLVLSSSGDRVLSPANGEYLAAHIPGARHVVIASDDHLPWFRDPDVVLGPVAEFVAGATPLDGGERQLATVLFTDIVESTRRAAELGDRQWHALLEHHDALAHTLVERHRGRWIKSTGDGMLAIFDGPARGVRCALALLRAWRELGLEARAGLHTGECDVSGADVGGIAVHIGARIAALAGPGEVLVSSTVRDLVAGSGLDFDDRGERALKGLDGTWRSYAASGP